MNGGYEQSIIEELGADGAAPLPGDGTGDALEGKLHSSGSVRLAPVEDLIATVCGVSREVLSFSDKLHEKLEKYRGKLRAEQRVELCEKLAAGHIGTGVFSMLWKVLFGEEIAEGESRNSRFYEEIMRLDEEKSDA
jgi:hypothetical protein